MAFTITGSLTIDETTGTQNAAASGDSTGNDVAGGLGTLIANVPEFDALLSLVVPPGVVPTNVSVSNANADNSTGSSLLTGFGIDVVDLAFTNSTGGPLAGEPAKFGAGAGDYLMTTDGYRICLYSYSGPDDPTLDENNVVFGRKANADGTANPAGAIVFAAYLQPTGAADVVLGSDVDALGAKVWMVEYEPLEHGIDGASAAAHDDARILADPLYVSVATRSDFSLEGAPSGQNLFLTFGDGTPAPGEVAIVVTAEQPANQSTGESITKGQTVNTGQGGGGTTIGNTNQMVDPGEGLYFSFVNGANDQLTVPNLDQNEADLESNIQFSSMFGALGASFAVVQLQQDSQASLTITALNTAAEPGENYIDGLGVGAGGDTIVNINWVKVSTFVKTGNTLSPGPTYVFTSDFYDPVSGASVDFKADGTVELIGLQANDVVSYRTGDSGGVLTHNRVLIRNSGDAVANASNQNAAFDIGKFSLSNAATDTDAFPVLAFEDDGPSVSTTGTLPVLTVDETILATDTTGDFSSNFSAVFGADGFGAGSYALAAGSEGMDSLLVDTASGNHVFLRTEAGVVVGREGTDATDAITGDIVFTVSVDSSGVVTLDQQRAVVHDDPLDPDESTSPATLAAGMVILSATATDGDGDTASAALNIGDKLNFEDDGPSVTVSVTDEESVLLTTQDAETDGDPTASDTASTTVNFSGAFSGAVAFGADGPGSIAPTFTLSLYGADGGASGLASDGAAVNLYNVGGVITGSTALTAGTIDATNTIFTIEVGTATGVVTLTQHAEIDHPIADDPTPTGTPFDDQLAVLGAGLVKLTASAIATDGDGDTATHSQDVDLGGNVRFADDGPSIGTTGTLPVLTVDETILANDATGDFSSNFSAVFGADGMGATPVSYALSVSSEGVDSLLVDTASGHHVFLRTEAGVVVGREGTDATDAITGDIVFTVSVDSSGVVTLDQQRAVVHDDPLDPDESTSPATLAAGMVILSATATDGDGDTASAALNIGDRLNFEDDGPSVSTTGTLPVLTVDETVLANDATGDFSSNFSAVFGADGFGAGSYALSVSSEGVDSLLVDTASGNHVFLRTEAGVVVGREGTDATDAITGDIVFTVSVDSSGVVTLDQQRAVVHDDPLDPDESTSPATLAAGMVILTATATDGDGDTASAALNIGDKLNFEDDGPSVSTTGTLPVLTVDETILANDATGDFSSNFSAVFGADGFGAGSYALAAGSEGMDSLLVDTASGHHVFLRTEAGVVVGREGTDATDAITGDIVFTVSVDSSGVVTLDQQRAVVHDDPLDPDESTSPATLAAGMVILSATATDGDGDTASAALNIGDKLNFEDDGPSVSTTGTLPVLTVDETILANDATGDFSSNFSAVFGADGMGATPVGYALSVSSEGVDSLLVDTASGHHVFLRTEAGVVVGREGTDATDAITGDIVFTVSVDSSGVVTLDQQRAVVHDDPLDPDESTSPATLAAGMVILSATATDGDGDTASAALNIGDKLNFEDDGPSLAVGNLVGTGTVLPQIGYWTGSFGNDGAGSTGLDISLTGFTLVRPDSTTTTGTYTFGELPLSPDATGAYLFGGTLTGDFDNNPGTANTSVDFSLTAYANGTYALDLVQGFSSTVTTSTAAGGLGAGGPDPVQTLYIPPPPATPTETVVFFSAKPLAADADILGGIGVGATDPTEAQLETVPLPAYIDPRSMNVSTSGIGVDNNLLQGYGTSATEAVDESFVANPLSLVNSMEVFIDNSVGGYTHSDGEILYYKVFYEDGTDSDNVLVTTDLGLPNKGQPVSFVVSGGAKMIDAIQLTMAYGEIKVPEIRFTTLVESLANDVKLDFSATLTDGDGDTATDAFSADLYANEIAGLFDFHLGGTASEQDAFNIDLQTVKNDYHVTGFDTGTDKLVLIGDATAVVTNIDNSGADSIVTITETGAQVTTVTVVGVDLLGSHLAFG